MSILLGLLSLVAVLGIGYLFSTDKKAINVRTVVSGILLQVAIIFFVLKVPVGQNMLESIALGVDSLVKFGMEGVGFVFGGISDGYVFAINVLALIIFTSALISVLYYLKVIPFLVGTVGRGIAKLMGTSEAETFSAVANSFLGGTEAPLVIKPYLSKLTKSELFAVLVGGFGSASASILAGYSAMGIDMKYLLIAVFTVPFSTLLMAKIMIPEVRKIKGETQQKHERIKIEGSTAGSFFEAISEGVSNGLGLALNVGAMLIGFIGLVAVVNAGLGLVGTSIGEIAGMLFVPIGYLMGIPASDMGVFANLMGTKLAVNEFVAYGNMGSVMADLTPRTIAILSVCLCNFANLSVIGIQIGGFTAFAPERRGEVAKLGAKALLSGTLATLTTAIIVGMLF